MAPRTEGDSLFGGSWCTYASVLDVEVPPIGGSLPRAKRHLSPPVAQYVEEALMGVRFGPGDAKAQRRRRESSMGPSTAWEDVRGAPMSPWRRVELLHAVLGGGSSCGGVATNVCKWLFWIALGAIFGRAQPGALGSYRKELGESWRFFLLETEKFIPHNRKVSDWVLAVVPFVFAQAIYRLLFDAFEEDRKTMLAEAGSLVEKLSLVVHFEVSGFQLNTYTVQQARRRLFIRLVLQSPHTDLNQYLKDRKRQELLESHKTASPSAPLEFGRYDEDVDPLDEVQLEHIMQGRCAQKFGMGAGTGRSRRSVTLSFSGDGDQDAPRQLVPQELSVDRYANLAEEGAQMHERHLAALAACLGDMSLEDLGEPEASDGEEDVSVYGASERSSLVTTKGTSLDRSSAAPGAGCTSVGGSTAGSNLSRAPSRPGHRGSAGSAADEAAVADESVSPVAWASGEGTLIAAGGELDEGDLAASSTSAPGSTGAQHFSSRIRRKRYDSKPVNGGSPNRSGKETTKAQQAKVLRMRQETLRNCIALEPLPKEFCSRELNTTWVSPVMVYSQPEGKDKDRGSVLHKSASESQTLKMASRPMKAVPTLRNLSQSGSSMSMKDDADVSGAGSCFRAVMSQRTKGRDSDATVLLGNTMSTASDKPSGETLFIGPPKNISNLQILQRLEAQSKSCMQQTFAEYMKGIDVLTGNPKTRHDAKRLSDEEQKYTKQMLALVGGPPKRMLALAPFQRARGANPPATSSTASCLATTGQ